MAAFLTPQEIVLLTNALEATERTRYLALACLTLILYEGALTWAAEHKFFWTGPWTISRILFFVNRYIPPVVSILGLICLFVPGLSLEAIPTVVTLDVCAIVVVQSIIVLRIWYLYTRIPLGRYFIVGCFIASTVANFVILATLWGELRPAAVDLPGITLIGCPAPPSHKVWRLFVPGIILHTILYLATTVPALRMKHMGKTSPLMNRILLDGGIFYLIIFITVGFSGIGALQYDPKISYPAIYSGMLLCVTSVAVSRLMLSIHSLADNLSLSPVWLLNNAELSRVHWRKGSHEGEIIVEVETAEEPDECEHVELEDVVCTPRTCDSPEHDMKHVLERPRTPAIHTTRVGVYDNSILDWRH